MRVGVLTIGSLFWETDRWRDGVLDFGASITVPFPIRYGRRSGTRDNGYTMVVAKSATPGSAKLVPVPMVDTFDDLERLAHEVADAERMGSELACSWACVALLPRVVETDIVQRWRDLQLDTSSVLATYAAEDVPIDPTAVVEASLWNPSLDSFDAVLVTITKPVANYPNIDNVADAMGAPPGGNKAHAYFRGNRRAGISTFQDDEILATLSHRGFAT